MANHTRKPSREAASPLISQFADDADMADLIEFFVGELEERTRAITTALEGGEMDQLGRMVHQIRGAAGGYGFPSISATAGELETLLRASEPEMSAVNEKVEALIHLCQRAAEGMKGSA